MREQYDKEMEHVHASPELIQRTKAAMRQEEERIHQQKEAEGKHNKMAGIWILAPAAVVLILVLAARLMTPIEEIPETKLPVRAGREELSENFIPRAEAQEVGSLPGMLGECLQKIKEMLTEEAGLSVMKE